MPGAAPRAKGAPAAPAEPGAVKEADPLLALGALEHFRRCLIKAIAKARKSAL